MLSDRHPSHRGHVELWPWRARVDDRTVEFERSPTQAVHVPTDFPAVDLNAEGIRNHDTAEDRRLPDDAQGFHRLDSGWLVGTDYGEFGGDVWWVGFDGSVRHIVAAHFHRFVTLGDDVYIVQGLGHLGLSTGSLLRVHADGERIAVEHALELPEAPRATLVQDGRLYLGIEETVVVVDGDMTLSLSPCLPTETFDGVISEDAIRDVVDRHRKAVDVCLEPLRERPFSCFPDARSSVSLLFRVNEHGRLNEVSLHHATPEPADEVSACLIDLAREWSFPKPDGGPAVFGYEFVRSRVDDGSKNASG